MSARSRKELLEQARARYRFRGREGRSRLLDEICALCGYERKYAIKVLCGRRPLAGERDLRRGGSARRYTEAERAVLKTIWCLPSNLPASDCGLFCRFGCRIMRSITVSWRLCCGVICLTSAATIDRL